MRLATSSLSLYQRALLPGKHQPRGDFPHVALLLGLGVLDDRVVEQYPHVVLGGHGFSHARRASEKGA